MKAPLGYRNIMELLYEEGNYSTNIRLDSSTRRGK